MGSTLIASIKNNNLKAFSRSMKVRGAVFETDPQGNTALHWAVKMGGVSYIKALILAGSNLGARNDDGQSPLMMTFTCLDCINLLLESGAKVDPRDNGQNTPLLFLFKGNPDPALVTSLILHGANVNARDVKGTTPLIRAAKWPYSESLRILLMNAADIDAVDLEGRSALSFAAFVADDPESVEFLVNSGANLTLRIRGGETALELYLSLNRYRPNKPRIIKALGG